MNTAIALSKFIIDENQSDGIRLYTDNEEAFIHISELISNEILHYEYKNNKKGNYLCISVNVYEFLIKKAYSYSKEEKNKLKLFRENKKVIKRQELVKPVKSVKNIKIDKYDNLITELNNKRMRENALLVLDKAKILNKPVKFLSKKGLAINTLKHNLHCE